jgi:enterochelin esterase-like enzyme
VVAHVDGNYRTIPLKQSRGIGGLSMGANGALQVAMNYPDIFGVVGAHSPTMRTYSEKLPWWGDETWFAQHDPATMVKTNQYIAQVKLWIDIGTEDTVWRPRALELKQNLLDRKINFTWKDFPGGHIGEYWAAHILDYLDWYNNSLSF